MSPCMACSLAYWGTTGVRTTALALFLCFEVGEWIRIDMQVNTSAALLDG